MQPMKAAPKAWKLSGWHLEAAHNVPDDTGCLVREKELAILLKGQAVANSSTDWLWWRKIWITADPQAKALIFFWCTEPK